MGEKKKPADETTEPKVLGADPSVIQQDIPEDSYLPEPLTSYTVAVKNGTNLYRIAPLFESEAAAREAIEGFKVMSVGTPVDCRFCVLEYKVTFEYVDAPDAEGGMTGFELRESATETELE